jgi:hypothetical protein
VIVQLSKLWLANVVTQELLSAQTGRSKAQEFGVPGEIRTYAGGRQRAVGSLGMAGKWTFTLMELSQTNTETLKTWMASGVTVLARDHRGQAMYGTFFGLNIAENMAQLYPTATYTADITLQAVDVVEGV